MQAAVGIDICGRLTPDSESHGGAQSGYARLRSMDANRSSGLERFQPAVGG